MRELVKQFLLGNTKGKNQFPDAKKPNAANFTIREAEFENASFLCFVHAEKITEKRGLAMAFFYLFFIVFFA